MTTIEINVSDETIARYGDARAIAARLEKLLIWEELSAKAQTLSSSLRDAGVSWEAITEGARQEVWDRYKNTIRDKLPPEAFD